MQDRQSPCQPRQGHRIGLRFAFQRRRSGPAGHLNLRNRGTRSPLCHAVECLPLGARPRPALGPQRPGKDGRPQAFPPVPQDQQARLGHHRPRHGRPDLSDPLRKDLPPVFEELRDQDLQGQRPRRPRLRRLREQTGRAAEQGRRNLQRRDAAGRDPAPL